MAISIKAAVCRAFGEPLAIETVSLADPGPGEVRVTLKACAICHSDISYAEGSWGGDLPIVLGHEASGIVESVGPGVLTAKPGDHVVVTLIRACHTCHYCAGEREFLCEETFGLDQTSPIRDANAKPLGHGLRTGAFAEAVVVDQSQVCVIDPSIAFDVASLFACGVLTGVGAVTRTANMPEGSHAVVIGCGGVGLNAVQGARLARAKTITAIDMADSKLDAAKAVGATHAINPAAQDAPTIVREITEGRGADFVFVTVGAKAAIDGANALIGSGGTIVIVGMPPNDVMAEYNPASFAGWSQKIIGSKMGSAKVDRDVPALVDAYLAGDLHLDQMVTGRYTLDQINEAIASTKSGEALRNVIVFD